GGGGAGAGGMKRGAYRPGGMDVQIEHVFVNANDPAFAASEIRRISEAGMVPMVTVEPWDGIPEIGDKARWVSALFRRGRVLVRFCHEMNGSWYPWASDPGRFRAMWESWSLMMPEDVELVWCPNVSYPGSAPIKDFWPDPDLVDWIGLDGYARHGESMERVFAPTLEELWRERIARYGKPVMLAETGTPRGRGQAKWWRDGIKWAERQGIAAVCCFNVKKDGPDEADWTLSKAAQRAFKEG
ncbi:MAG TPA: hypothetical protein VGE74_14170, partial [Gemmata sp.]